MIKIVDLCVSNIPFALDENFVPQIFEKKKQYPMKEIYYTKGLKHNAAPGSKL